jgi:glucuronoarabinoxylan endo-1,4-beta-xylanase
MATTCAAAALGCGDGETGTGGVGARARGTGGVSESSGIGGIGGMGSGGLPSTTSNTGSKTDGEVDIDLDTEYQVIRGYGGINVIGGPGIPSWEIITDLTPAQVDTAFGAGEGQVGLSILRLRISYDKAKWADEIATAKRASEHGAIVFASPWSPPASMKSNQRVVGGSLNVEAYGDYADHLIAFRDFMESSGVPIYAVSVQNEPDIAVDYESCDWTVEQLTDFLSSQGAKLGSTKVIAAESFNFNHAVTDPILNSPTAEPNVDIIGGHIYGGGLNDYPLARDKGKEVWMTEHFTDSTNQANDWPQAFAVGEEIDASMKANFNAYVWWYIRRSYGLITDDGQISKRGYLMAQYSRFVRPGAIRIGATNPQASGVSVTAYKQDGRVVVVAVNAGGESQDVTIDVHNGYVASFSRYTTSESKNLTCDGTALVTDNRSSVVLDARSVTTLVSN